MINSEEFSKRLQIIMDYYGLTPSGLADVIEFNRSSISHLLSGRNKPSLEFVMKVLEHFPEVKLYWLLNGKGNFPDIDSPASETKQIPLVENKKPAKENLSPEIKEKFDLHIKKKDIDRIVIFFKDGTFKEYKN